MQSPVAPLSERIASRENPPGPHPFPLHPPLG
jgi:hypothetical protein